ncbi:MAG: hypothetical protein KTR20_00440 [Cellvibrionaceae bacterium]|nr:hypothetical protein [Cellvibrionaceae bacterium]
MSQVFILRNADGYFLSKSGGWVDGRDATALYRSAHKDEALNQLFETNSKDVSLRMHLVPCQLNPKKHPQIAADQLPPPLLTEAIDKDINPTEDKALDHHTHVAEPA